MNTLFQVAIQNLYGAFAFSYPEWPKEGTSPSENKIPKYIGLFFLCFNLLLFIPSIIKSNSDYQVMIPRLINKQRLFHNSNQEQVEDLVVNEGEDTLINLP